ncbi:MAG: hypothetical protein QGH77_05140 [Planctomycetota bacterium]|nr:hypothetical protein [Planctomycetota bacterium]
MKRLLPLCTLLLLPSALLAQSTWYVPGDFPTIQDAINASLTGDTIMVSSGTYPENLDFQSKGLVLKSVDGASATTISGGANNTLLLLDNTPATTVVDGFTLTGGNGRPSSSSWGYDYYGGAVHASNGAIALVKNCSLIRNQITTGTFAGGAYAGGAGTQLTLEHCVIAYNHAWASGGATLADYYAEITLNRCTVFGNTSTNFFGQQGGVAGANHGDTWVNDCIIWGNYGNQIDAFGSPYNVGVDFYVTYTDVEGGYSGTGNIDADPLFVDLVNGDFHLQSGSPCIDAGNPSSSLDPDGTRADMGAFYFDQSGPTLTVSNLIAGQTAQVDIDNCTPAGAVFFVWSVAGGGPISTPFGDGYVSPPYNVIRLNADSAGAASQDKNVPGGASGVQVWFHGADAGSATMLNALALTIG